MKLVTDRVVNSLRILSLTVLGCAALAIVFLAEPGGSTPVAAQAPDTGGIPAFAAAPRFATGRAAPAMLGTQSATNATCNPGPERVSADGRHVSLDLPLRRVATRINNPTETEFVYGRAVTKFDDLELRAYSGCLTSPTIEVLPGQSIDIALHNDLPSNDPTCTGAASYLQLPPGVGCFNTTNIHFHGLHVSPKDISDNVLRTMPPNASPYPVHIDLPANHPAGTFWYHAHMHGSTAIGVSSADAGVIVIRGTRDYVHRAQNGGIVDIDTVLHGANKVRFADTIFEFQQIPYGCFLQSSSQAGPYDQLITTKGLYTTADSQASSPPASANAPWSCTYKNAQGTITKGVIENFNTQMFSATIWDTNGRFTSINGVVQPRITVAAGAIQRWRFVHAGIHDTINVQVVRMTQVLGLDGKSTSFAARLAGKTRAQQATVLKSVCVATPQTVVPQLEIAVDGLTRTKINEIRLAQPGVSTVVQKVASNYLQPGYRSDVLIAFPADGDYCLLDQAAPPGERVVVHPKDGTVTGNGGQGPSIPQLLAYVHVEGGTPIPGGAAGVERYVTRTLYDGNPELPERVRAGLLTGDLTTFAPFVSLSTPSPNASPTPYAHFAISNAGVFAVNGSPYPIATPAIQPVLIRQLGTTEDWDVRIDPTPAPSGSPTGAEPHIFHIHVNPFEIVDVRKMSYKNGKLVYTSIFNPNTGKCLPNPDREHLAEQYCGLYHVFRDTLFIENGYDVTLRTRYDVYDGEFVLHCHILDHEDAGMMANVMIARDRLHPPPLTQMIMPAMAAHK